MILKSTLRLTLLALAVASVSTVQAQSSVASPFGAATAGAANAAGMSKAHARAALSQAATAKVNARFLEQLLDAEGGEFLVTFNVDTVASAASPAQKLESDKAAIRAARRNVQASINSLDITYVHEYTALPLANVKIKSRAALVQLLNHPGVNSITKLAPTTVFMTESRALIHAPAANIGQNGAGTAVAVIDSGLNYTLPEFGNCTAAAQPSSCRVAATYVSTAVAGDAFSTSGVPSNHGTNVAGVVASVAPATRIVAVDAMPDTGGTHDMVLRGIDWVINNRAAHNIVAVNISIGLTDSAAYATSCPGTVGSAEAQFTDAVARLRAANIMPVFAAGNSRWTNGVSSPSCVPGAISVGAIWDARYTPPSGDTFTFNPGTSIACTEPASETRAYKVPCFSNSGPRLDLFAPGVYINAAGLQYGGTSQAAPHVAGAVAVLRGISPNESLSAIQTRLTKAGLIVTDSRSGSSLVKPRLDLLGGIANNHYKVAQQLYLAYYGRPGDIGGMAFWSVALANAGAPTTVSALSNAYSSNPQIKSIVDSFAGAQESQDLYGGKTTRDFVSAVYMNAFKRAAEPAGVDYWAGVIDNGYVTRGQAAIAIVGGAQGTDLTTFDKKTEATRIYTTLIDTPLETVKFAGNTAMASARVTIGRVDHTTDMASYTNTIAQDLFALTNAP